MQSMIFFLLRYASPGAEWEQNETGMCMMNGGKGKQTRRRKALKQHVKGHHTINQDRYRILKNEKAVFFIWMQVASQ